MTHHIILWLTICRHNKFSLNQFSSLKSCLEDHLQISKFVLVSKIPVDASCIPFCLVLTVEKFLNPVSLFELHLENADDKPYYDSKVDHNWKPNKRLIWEFLDNQPIDDKEPNKYEHYKDYNSPLLILKVSYFWMHLAEESFNFYLWDLSLSMSLIKPVRREFKAIALTQILIVFVVYWNLPVVAISHVYLIY